jgi:hypothetical protein
VVVASETRGENHPKTWLPNNPFGKLTILFQRSTTNSLHSLTLLSFQAYSRLITMKFFNNNSNNKTIRFFGLAAVVLVLCLSFATATVVEQQEAAAAVVIPGGGAGGGAGGGGGRGQLRGDAAAANQHPAEGRELRGGGSCGTYNHPYAVYCKFACPYYRTTARCIVDHWICKGC